MCLVAWTRRLISILRTNWRLKLIVLSIVILLSIIFYQRHLLKKAEYAHYALKVEQSLAGKDIAAVSSRLNQLKEQHLLDKDFATLGKLSLKLDSSAVLLGADPIETDVEGDVCPEKYLGNQFWPYQYNNWGVKECNYAKDIARLVTLLFRSESKDHVRRVTDSLWKVYPGVKVLVETDLEYDVNLVQTIRRGQSYADIGRHIRTKYVLVADDLDYVSNWTNLDRGVRLLSEGGLPVLAVGGALRNSSGHWHVDCHQMNLKYYRLEIKPGYEFQFKDCMVCDFVDGPLMMKTDTLLGLDPLLSRHLSKVDLGLSKEGLMLSCPDLIYFTHNSVGREALKDPKAAWLELANKHKFQGLVTHFKSVFDYKFSCSDLNLSCDIESQAAAFILPWCCFESFRHILRKLEEVSIKYGADYQLESGSCLGAVKLANFIPWDIDMDVEFLTEHFHLFKAGGAGNALLSEAGISLYSFSEDMYHIKGAGYFKMYYNGISVEMMGSLKPLSRNILPGHLGDKPTRVQLDADLWIPVMSNPGLYSRGRYGPGYLFHIQSWRHKDGMSGSYDTYHPGAWAPCSQPGHHACLNNYPIQGNMELLSEVYP